MKIIISNLKVFFHCLGFKKKNTAIFIARGDLNVLYETYLPFELKCNIEA